MIKRLYLFLILSFSTLLSACNLKLLDTKGAIATAEKHLLIDSVLLMLIVVVPVILLCFFFTWRYRINRQDAKYDPKWSHSYTLEAVCWVIPLIIIAILATMTWVSSHRLDPYRPLDNKKPPIIIEAVALNWKWLFIYPKEQIATVNYLQFPVDTPIRFMVTSDAPMNSFAIQQLAGQIYAMAGMRTKLNLIADHKGIYTGLSTNYSGDGFSGMRFDTLVSSQASYDRWVTAVKSKNNPLDFKGYQQLVKPSSNDPARFYSSAQPGLFNLIIKKYTGESMTMSPNT